MTRPLSARSSIAATSAIFSRRRRRRRRCPANARDMPQRRLKGAWHPRPLAFTRQQPRRGAARPLFFPFPLAQRAGAHIEGAGEYRLAHPGALPHGHDLGAGGRLQLLDPRQVHRARGDLLHGRLRHDARAAKAARGLRDLRAHALTSGHLPCHDTPSRRTLLTTAEERPRPPIIIRENLDRDAANRSCDTPLGVLAISMISAAPASLPALVSSSQ